MGRDHRRRGSMTVGAKTFWSQLRSAPSIGLTIFGATLLTALLVTAVPRVLEQVSDDDLRVAVEQAEPEQRNIRAETRTWLGIGPDDDPFRFVREEGEELLEEGFPASVRSLFYDTQYLMTTPQFEVASFPDGVQGPFPRFFRFRYQEGIEEEMTLLRGSMPQHREPVEMLEGTACPAEGLPPDGFVAGDDCSIVDVPHLEVVLTEETAEALMVSVGDRVILGPDGRDPRWFSALGFGGASQLRVVLSISGIVELTDPEQEYWFADTVIHRPRIVENPDFRHIYGVGVIAADLHGELHEAIPFMSFNYSWRYFIDPDSIRNVAVTQLATDLEKISAPAGIEVVTLLPDLIDDFIDQRALTLGLMSTAITGILVVALAVILNLALLVATREAGAIVLMRNRGASRGQLLMTWLYTGMILVVPAVVIGYLLTASWLPDTSWIGAGRTAAAFAVGGAIAVLVASAPYLVRRLGALQHLDFEPATSARRLVAEGFVMVAAVAALLLLRRRGQAEGFEIGRGGIDLLLALAPAVVGVAVGLLLLRIMGPVMRGGAWVAARGRSLVSFIGLRRLSGMSGVGRAPILVILLAVGVAVFSSVVRASVAEGQETHSWQVVGADYRINDFVARGVPLPQRLDPEQLGGSVWAVGAEYPETMLLGPSGPHTAFLLAVEVGRYRDVLADSSSDPGFLEPIVWTAGDPLPALVSSYWGGASTPQMGEMLTLELGVLDPTVRVAGVVDRFPSLPHPGPFVVVDLESLRGLTGMPRVADTVIYLNGDAAARESLVSDLAEADPGLRLLSRHQTLANIAADPFASWVDRGLEAVTYLSTVFAVVAAISALALTSARRRRDLAYLRTLGLRTDQATRITALEQLPPVIVATLVGAGLGAGMAVVLSPALDITSFTGRLLPAEIVVYPGTVLLVAGAQLILLTVAVIVSVAMSRRQDHARLLRIGEE